MDDGECNIGTVNMSGQINQIIDSHIELYKIFESETQKSFAFGLDNKKARTNKSSIGEKSIIIRIVSWFKITRNWTIHDYQAVKPNF